MKTISLYVPIQFDVPPWANYIAIDANRRMHAYSHKPVRNVKHGSWVMPQARARFEQLITLPDYSTTTWKKSLQSV